MNLRTSRGLLAAAGAGVALSTVAQVTADPPALPALPSVFCFRITDIERVPGDISDCAFTIEFEVLNWADRPAGAMFIAQNIGGFGAVPAFFPPFIPSGPPRLAGAGVDPDGRGGPLGGSDIGPGVFDAPAIHSGRGRGDLPGLLNDWAATFATPTSVLWTAVGGTLLPARDLIAGGGGAASFALVPGLGFDGILDTAIDGGPAPYGPDPAGTPFPTGGPPIPDGSGNVLDGFTLTVCDWDEGEILSFNWFLLDAAGAPIGTVGFGNAYGFGVVNLIRLPAGAAPPGALFAGNGGFTQNINFFDSVFIVPGPPPGPITEGVPQGQETTFAVEFGAAVTAPFLNPNDRQQVPGAQPNTQLIFPEQHPCSPLAATCPQDLNGDGVVNGADITSILNAFGLVCDQIPTTIFDGTSTAP
ncbi:MAG: hypothetical protein D6693_07955 [Planctomycetota bacterium]|nr:MAG: hypothetical protein D6693_07955 [Planctomycetota bacterium]